MFEFYTNCTFEGINSVSWVSFAQFFVQSLTLIIASIALYTARKSLNIANENLGGVSRTQSVQAHMNLITLETDITKNIINLAITTRKVDKAITPDEIETATLEKNTAFTFYLSALDKLACIINTPYFPQQFRNNEGKVDKEKWKTEYYDIFDKAKTSGNTDTVGFFGKTQMIRNITIILDIWDKENLENTKDITKNTNITNALPNT